MDFYYYVVTVVRIRAERHFVGNKLHDPQKYHSDTHNKIHTCTDRKAYTGCHPYAGCCGKAFNVSTNFNDDTGTKKRDTAYSLCGNSRGISAFSTELGHDLCCAQICKSVFGNDHDQGRCNTHQNVGADTGFFEMIAALKADRSADEESDKQTECKVNILHHRKVSEINISKCHNSSLQNSFSPYIRF